MLLYRFIFFVVLCLLLFPISAHSQPVSSNTVTCGTNPYALIVAGQSNGTNEAPGPAYTPRHQTWQVSIGENLLFVSADPLRGTTRSNNNTGVTSFMLPLMDALIDHGGPWDCLILVPIAVGGTSSADWLNGWVSSRIPLIGSELAAWGIQPLAILWMQGEAEAGGSSVSAEQYKANVRAIRQRFVNAGVDAPFYVPLETLCHANTQANRDRIRGAQAQLPDGVSFFAGPDFDTLVPAGDRYDGCHFSHDAAWTTVVDAWYQVLTGSMPPPPPPPPPPACATFNALNPSDKSSRITLSLANLRAASNGSNFHAMVRAIAALAEDSYYEFTMAGQGAVHTGPPVNIVGVQDAVASVDSYVGGTSLGFGIGYNAGYGGYYNSGFTRLGSTVPLSNATFGVAYKHATREIWIRNSNGWLSGDPVAGNNPTAVTVNQSPLYPAASLYGSSSGNVTFNFGASPFVYTPPSGYRAGACQ